METITIKDNDLKVFFNCCNRKEPSRDSTPLSNLCPPVTYEEEYKVLQGIEHLDIQEICITYKPKYHKKNPTTLHRETRKYIIRYMKEHEYFKPYYIFVPEFTKAGILHYHGIVYFDNANDYWVADLKRKLGIRFGITQGKAVSNLSNYWKYIMKDTQKQKFTIQVFSNLKAGQPAKQDLVKIGQEGVA